MLTEHQKQLKDEMRKATVAYELSLIDSKQHQELYKEIKLIRYKINDMKDEIISLSSDLKKLEASCSHPFMLRRNKLVIDESTGNERKIEYCLVCGKSNNEL